MGRSDSDLSGCTGTNALTITVLASHTGKAKRDGFVIPDVNVSSIVSDTDTFFIFSVCYWGKDEAMESDFNCKSISGR